MTLASAGYATPAGRERHLVEIVDAGGAAIRAATVAQAHHTPGELHRAFSVMLRDDAGRFLLQQRAAGKTRFALRWANTCCGHPWPGEDLVSAAAKRLAEEMGLAVTELTEAGRFVYRAEDPATGRVEHEYDHVLVGRVPTGTEPRPDRAEVADWRWVEPSELRVDLALRPGRYVPWLEQVVRLASA